MSKLPAFARIVNLYPTPKVNTNLVSRFEPKNSVGFIRPLPKKECPEVIEQSLANYYRLPPYHYLMSAPLALVAGWQIGNRMRHEWAIQWAAYDVYFPAHH
jgi:hypothetical protein